MNEELARTYANIEARLPRCSVCGDLLDALVRRDAAGKLCNPCRQKAEAAAEATRKAAATEYGRRYYAEHQAERREYQRLYRLRMKDLEAKRELYRQLMKAK